MKFLLSWLFATTLFTGIFADNDSVIYLKRKLSNDTCTCTKAISSNQDEINAAQRLANEKQVPQGCGEDCFELVFLIDGRNPRGNNENDFNVVTTWVYRVTQQIVEASGNNPDNFLVIIQYADIQEMSLASQLDGAIAQLEERVTAIQPVESVDVIDQNESAQILTDGLDSLLKFLEANDQEQNQGIQQQSDMLDKYRTYRNTTQSCKKILFTFTHSYVTVDNSLPTATFDKIKKYFDRTDVVTVSFRGQNDDNLARESLLQSPNGVTYEYFSNTHMISSVNEVVSKVCEPLPKVNYVCDVELAFLVDASHCACNNVDELFRNVRQFVNSVAYNYRSSKQLLLGKGLNLGFTTFYKQNNTAPLQFKTEMDMSHYPNLAKDNQGTTSLDDFRAAIFNFDENKLPYSDYIMPISQKIDIPLGDIIADAETLFTATTEADKAKATRILVVLKGEDSEDEIDLDRALRSQITALEKRHDENVKIMVLPITENVRSPDNSEAHMLNAVLDMHAGNSRTSVLDHKNNYNLEKVQTFENMLARVETCSDNELPSGQTAPSYRRTEEYECSCPINVKLEGNGGCVIGPQGHKGVPGDMGDVGEPGINGLDGHKGIQGATGAHGEVGPKGEQGEVGQAGEKGFHGLAGFGGQQGPPGKDGEAGEDGVTSRYSWEDIFERVDRLCNCNGGCSDRSTDWMGVDMIDSQDFDVVYGKMLQYDESNFLSSEDEEWLRNNF